MTREELIEEAAAAIFDAADLQLAPDDHRWELARRDARAALAVFEKAQTPTDEEREAHRRVIELWFANWRSIGNVSPALEVAIDSLEGMVDEALAAGFRRPAQGDYYEGLEEGIAIGRRPVQGEPTDAQIERAARSIAEWSTSDVPLELCRSVARHALRAAFTAGQEDKP